MNEAQWQNRMTMLVNSCDAYEDLWQPFFTLLKRYFCAAGYAHSAQHREQGLPL